MAGQMSQSNWRVLIADDDPAICTLIDTVLRKGPYEMVMCNDAESALVAVDRQGPFDIIICDFMLPGISGIDLIERLRGKEGTRGVPILMISGHTNYAMDGRAKIFKENNTAWNGSSPVRMAANELRMRCSTS